MQRYIVSLFYKKISKTTLARKFSCLRSFQTFLQAQGIDLKINIKNPRIDRKLPIILSVDEIFFLLDDIKNEDLPTRFPCRDKCIFELIYATGVRCSELVSITINNINFAEKTIKIMGKGRKERIVLFGNKAIDMMQKYLLFERPALLKKGEERHLFLNYFGDALSTRSVQRIFEMFRHFLKLERQLSPHKVRHSFATHLLNQGADLRMIQELLGHKTIATTEIYTHITNQQLAKMCDEKHPLNNLNDLVFSEKL
jgi:site-specific recombinase XerD